MPAGGELAPGTSLGRYSIIRLLARGGMAEVYLAHADGAADFQIAVIKRILPELARDPRFIDMFLDEARVVTALHHPNIVQVYDVGRAAGDYFIVMEYLHGETLASVMREAARSSRGLPLELAVAVASELAAGLHHAHEQPSPDGAPLDIVHRDVSPANVILTFDGSAKLVDFGIAKATQRRTRTLHGVRKGKAAYMAPEQWLGKPVDRKTDVFALGILLYEMTTLRRLFRALDMESLATMIVHRDAPRPSEAVEDYPAELDAIVGRALRRDPAERYASALELRQALEQFADRHPPRASPGDLAEYLRESFGPQTPPEAERVKRPTQRPTRVPGRRPSMAPTMVWESLATSGTVKTPTVHLGSVEESGAGLEPPTKPFRRTFSYPVAATLIGAALLAVAATALWLGPGDGNQKAIRHRPASTPGPKPLERAAPEPRTPAAVPRVPAEPPTPPPIEPVAPDDDAEPEPASSAHRPARKRGKPKPSAAPETKAEASPREPAPPKPKSKAPDLKPPFEEPAKKSQGSDELEELLPPS